MLMWLVSFHYLFEVIQRKGASPGTSCSHCPLHQKSFHSIFPALTVRWRNVISCRIAMCSFDKNWTKTQNSDSFFVCHKFWWVPSRILSQHSKVVHENVSSLGVNRSEVWFYVTEIVREQYTYACNFSCLLSSAKTFHVHVKTEFRSVSNFRLHAQIW